ncbi:MAG: helix-turn-helix domain-containing protein [Oscillospiraceae bacterium]|nr:helix-turn-helix domain-containing protein [Oscillospiraceae bacterium]
MLNMDKRAIGNKLLERRKRLGLTQEEVAEAAGLSGRTYADIERGTSNMRIETALRICDALRITPDAILTQSDPKDAPSMELLLQRLRQCTPDEQSTALALLDVYLRSIRR